MWSEIGYGEEHTRDWGVGRLALKISTAVHSFRLAQFRGLSGL